MSKEFTDDLVNTLNEIRKINKTCDNDPKLKEYVNLEYHRMRNEFKESYLNDFTDIDDNDICKRYIIDILLELGIDVKTF